MRNSLTFNINNIKVQSLPITRNKFLLHNFSVQNIKEKKSDHSSFKGYVS